jgi:HD-like signal output (HDOD) protein
LPQVCERALLLPCSPALLPRIAAAIADPDSSAEDIARIIMVDAALATSTLRLANSSYFSGGAPAATVADAVVRLGQRELFRLAALGLVSRWETVAGARGEPGDFCRHALCTAFAAEILAEATEAVDPQTAYTAGLVCDLGALAITHACAAFFPVLRAHCASGRATWAEAERAVLGYTRAEVGAHLLRVWRFPEELVAAAAFCDRPAQAPAAAAALVAHVHAGKYVATSFGPGVPAEGFLFELDATVLAANGFTPELLEESMTLVHERAGALLKDRLTHGALAS